MDAGIWSLPLIDAILGLIVLEAFGLWAFQERLGHRMDLTDILANLASGGFIVLALRFALADMAWPWTPALLASAGLAHVVDLSRRW